MQPAEITETPDIEATLTAAAAEEKAIAAAVRLIEGIQALNKKAVSENPELRDMAFEPDYDELRPALASSFARVLARYYTIVPTKHAQSRPAQPRLGESENPEVKRLLNELNDPGTSHERRAAIGDRLAGIGDPRSGVGLRQNGLPDFAWCSVPGGEITLEDNAGAFQVDPFYIAKYPVTYGQYRSFLVAEDGYRNKRWWDRLAKREEKPGGQHWKSDKCPAENVSWYDAVAFCRWLSEQLSCEIRLPTEWEWQQAATGGNPANEFPWGEDWSFGYANTSESGLSHTAAVGMYPRGASPVGALDMSGNVWEWCLNEYADPRRKDLAGAGRRVVRGGSWLNYLIDARASCRLHAIDPANRSSALGFRVVCSTPVV